jgi:hypothetical protein
MDALAQLALMSKAKLVFENAGTFLSFPVLESFTYNANDLNFDSASMTNAQHLVLSEFSRLVNSRPTGTIFQMEADVYLWEVYKQLLDTAIIARGKASTDDPAFQEAVKLLTTVDAHGLVTDSVAMTTYKQYRDASINATEDYKAQQSTAEFSNDPAVQNQWVTVDEPRLRAIKEQADEDWRLRGLKNEIERAQQIQQAHAANSPQTTWDQWSALFDPSIDVQTDSNTQQFALASYAPQGIFHQDWTTFSLTRNEITQLADQAPQELRDIFAIQGSISRVETLSFEFRSVAVTRPWFRPALFEARFWNLPDGSQPLSDGANPPQGAWPAYTAALVLVRNLSLTLRGEPAGQTGPTEPVRAASILMIDSAVLRSRMIRTAPIFARPAPQPPAMITARSVNVPGAIRMTAMRANPVMAPAAAITARPANTIMLARLSANAFTTLRAEPAPQPQPPPPQPPPATPNTTIQGSRDEISILAFICKRIPRSPNPDPTLTW